MSKEGCTTANQTVTDPDILLLVTAALATKTHGAARRAPTLRSAPHKRVLPTFLSKGWTWIPRPPPTGGLTPVTRGFLRSRIKRVSHQHFSCARSGPALMR